MAKSWPYLIVIAILLLVAIVACLWALFFASPDPRALSESYKHHHLLKFTPNDRDDLRKFQLIVNELPLIFWSTQFVAGLPVFVQVRPENLTAFANQMELLDLPFSVVCSNLQKAITGNPYAVRTLNASLIEHRPAAGDDEEFDLDAYNALDRIERYLKHLEIDYPDMVSLHEYGDSHEGHPLWYLHIAENKNSNISHSTDTAPENKECKPKKQIVFFECGIHAREWLSPAVCLQFISGLLNDVDRTVRLKQFEFYFAPMFNPDGYAYTWTTDRMWRKNRRKLSATCYGVDLNRNFGTGFKSLKETQNEPQLARTKRQDTTTTESYTTTGINSGSPTVSDGSGEYMESSTQQSTTGKPELDINHFRQLDNPDCPRLNPGNSPFSERETHFFYALMKHKIRKPTLYFSMHSYSQVWIYPYGYSNKTSKYHEEMEIMTRLGVQRLQERHGAEWKAGGTIETLYGANGISIDWVHEDVAVPYVFTVEMRDKGEYGFLLPEEQIRPAAEEVWAGVDAVLEHLIEKRANDEPQESDC